MSCFSECFKKKENKGYIVDTDKLLNHTCIICLSEFKIGQSVKVLDCNHMYHNECINEWYKRKKVCPICDK